MPKTDPRVDAYIAQAADFAQPVLSRIASSSMPPAWR
jgi:hypothetical protein